MSCGFGIVGLGLIADFHAQAIRAMGEGRLVAGFSSFPQEVQAFAGKYGCRGYSDLDAFLADPEVQIVTICTPSGAHLEPALAAAQAGKHVICEKPLEVTLERCDRIIAACAAAGMNQSIHAVDLLQWLMGPVESVSAFSGTLGHERIEVEDAAVAVLQFQQRRPRSPRGDHRGPSRLSEAAGAQRHPGLGHPGGEQPDRLELPGGDRPG